MKRYEKGQLIKLVADEKKNRPVTFGVVKKVSDSCMTVKFYDILRLVCEIQQSSPDISIASTKEVEHFVSLRKNELRGKIEEAKKYYRRETREIKNWYITLQPFINQIDK